MFDKAYYIKCMKASITNWAVAHGYHVRINVKLNEKEIQELKKFLKEDFGCYDFEIKQARKYLHITNLTLKEENISYPDTKECWFGTGYHVGDGAYSDDDGDNWDFFWLSSIKKVKRYKQIFLFFSPTAVSFLFKR